jgi:hypothetical protein
LAISFFITFTVTVILVVVLIFLATEVLVNEIQEHTLSAVTELTQGVHHS